MTVAVIADAHLMGPGGPPEPLIAQLDELEPGNCDRLVLLGDLFHIWIGFSRYETPEIRAVVQALERLRGRGVPMDYIEGNRDFYIAGEPYRGVFDTVGRETAFKAGGRRYLAIHGDGLNDRDYQYRMWRFLSKNPASRLAMRALPRMIARPLVYRTEAELAKTNFKHKVEIPEAVISRYAEQRLSADAARGAPAADSEGYDVLILGHFHEPRQWQVEGGEVLLLDSWFNTHKIEWFPPT